jgi:hypothetical protein
MAQFFDESQLISQLMKASYWQGRLSGIAEQFSPTQRQEALAEVLVQDVIKTSAIEGELLQAASASVGQFGVKRQHTVGKWWVSTSFLPTLHHCHSERLKFVKLLLLQTDKTCPEWLPRSHQMARLCLDSTYTPRRYSNWNRFLPCPRLLSCMNLFV